jgi:two-component system, NarL family, response regulator DegU
MTLNRVMQTNTSATIQKLLIVDDHADTRRWVRFCLSDLVEDFCELPNGEDIVRAYAEQRPEWVLMDVELGTVDGFAATRSIKKEFPEARILMVTNHQDETFERAAFDAGAVHLLPKEELWKVHHILEAAQGRLNAAGLIGSIN